MSGRTGPGEDGWAGLRWPQAPPGCRDGGQLFEVEGPPLQRSGEDRSGHRGGSGAGLVCEAGPAGEHALRRGPWPWHWGTEARTEPRRPSGVDGRDTADVLATEDSAFSRRI